MKLQTIIPAELNAAKWIITRRMKSHPMKKRRTKRKKEKKPSYRMVYVVVIDLIIEPCLSTGIHTVSSQDSTEYGVHGVQSPVCTSSTTPAAHPSSKNTSAHFYPAREETRNSPDRKTPASVWALPWLRSDR